MTNQKFRDEAAEILEKHIGNKAWYGMAVALLAKYEQALTDCENKLNEAIEVIEVFVNTTPDYNVSPAKAGDLKASVLMDEMINYPKKKALEFLNKVGK